jgi:hypothetical protein
MPIYPAQIDTIITLPKAIDNKTPINGIVFNNLRDTIVGIEQELGIKPSGLYSTVRARLDALDVIINQLIAGSSVFGGDLIVQSDPDKQYVIGLMGNAITSNLSIDTGASLRWDGTYWTQEKLYQDDILPPFFVSLDGYDMQEVMQPIINPLFTAIYNFDPPTSIILSDTDGYTQYIPIVNRLSFASNNSYMKDIFDGYVDFTLSATHHNTTKTSVHKIIWGQKNYWGIGPTGFTSASDIMTNLDGYVNNSLASNFTITAGLADKIYFAYRSDYGVATFTIGGFAGGFTLVSNTISLTNDFGFTENYTLYESDNTNLGNTTIVVS